LAENVDGMFPPVKTTTVYSLLHELKFADRTIVSLEDPVEYELDGVTQVQLDEKHHLSFAEGVKAMLRLDPDFLMIGEIRDGASAKAAVEAAITGRVLLSTIHSRDAVGVVTALRNWGMADHGFRVPPWWCRNGSCAGARVRKVGSRGPGCSMAHP
jgi:general secretion pathway protein E